MKVALMGGSFNPPTILHTTMVDEILRIGIVDEVWFVPSANHPFKHSQSRKSHLSSFKDRCKMIEIAIQTMTRRESVHISFVEQIFKLSGYTWETVEWFQTHYKDIEFFWVVGTDCVNEFPKWTKIDWLLDNVSFIVYPRPGYTFDANSMYGQKLLKQKHLILSPKQVHSFEGSSTQARENPDGGLLHPDVVNYWKNITNK